MHTHALTYVCIHACFQGSKYHRDETDRMSITGTSSISTLATVMTVTAVITQRRWKKRGETHILCVYVLYCTHQILWQQERAWRPPSLPPRLPPSQHHFILPMSLPCICMLSFPTMYLKLFLVLGSGSVTKVNVREHSNEASDLGSVCVASHGNNVCVCVFVVYQFVQLRTEIARAQGSALQVKKKEYFLQGKAQAAQAKPQAASQAFLRGFEF